MPNSQAIEFKKHSSESAPAACREMLAALEREGKGVPNLVGVLAESPAALHSYVSLHQINAARSSLTAVQQHVVFLTASFENECAYCMAGHSAAAKADGVDARIVNALRDGNHLPDDSLETLRGFTAELVIGRGFVAQHSLQRMLGAGYTRANVLDVIVAVASKTISNYVCQLVGIPLDDAALSHAWTPPSNLSAA